MLSISLTYQILIWCAVGLVGIAIIGSFICCICCCCRKKKGQTEQDPDVVELHPEKGKQTDAPSDFELQDHSSFSGSRADMGISKTPQNMR
jgi:hypothetical protein